MATHPHSTPPSSILKMIRTLSTPAWGACAEAPATLAVTLGCRLWTCWTLSTVCCCCKKLPLAVGLGCQPLSCSMAEQSIPPCLREGDARPHVSAASLLAAGPAVVLPQAGLALSACLLQPEQGIDPWPEFSALNTLQELAWRVVLQATYCCDKLGLDREKVNVNGGAIAMGHPLGATGARCTATLLHEMQKRGKAARFGVVSMCIGSGMGAAAVFERGERLRWAVEPVCNKHSDWPVSVACLRLQCWSSSPSTWPHCQAGQCTASRSLLAKPDFLATCHMSAAGGEVDQYRYARPNPSQSYLSRDAQA